jgi:Holliday junction resolvase RusA-like endonuclease
LGTSKKIQKSQEEKDREKYYKVLEKIETSNPWKRIELFLNIEPEPYARPRKSRKLEELGRSNVFYNPKSGYKKKLRKEIQKQLSEIKKFQLIDGEVHLYTEIGLMPPKKYTKSKTKFKLLIDRIITPTVRPDVDNWVKPIMDVLNKLVYEDDGQITELHVYKVYSTSEHPYIKINLQYRQEIIKLR